MTPQHPSQRRQHVRKRRTRFPCRPGNDLRLQGRSEASTPSGPSLDQSHQHHAQSRRTSGVHRQSCTSLVSTRSPNAAWLRKSLPPRPSGRYIAERFLPPAPQHRYKTDSRLVARPHNPIVRPMNDRPFVRWAGGRCIFVAAGVGHPDVRRDRIVPPWCRRRPDRRWGLPSSRRTHPLRHTQSVC